MTEQPFNLGGYLDGGVAAVANKTGRPELVIGKQIFARLEDGSVIGPAIIESIDLSHAGTVWGAEIRTTPPSVEHSITFEQIPPKTRREKRDRNAFDRLFWGNMLPNPVKRRQLIHKGGKP